MSNNLKEEINQFFKDNDEYNMSKDTGYTINRFEIALTKDELINSILEIIEKRIDSILKSNQRFHNANLHETPAQTLDEYYKGYMNGKFDILKEVKELLK